jgi:hypothetical protein
MRQFRKMADDGSSPGARRYETEWRGDWTGANELGRIYELELP